jgi:Tfp pilus assembly protein PilF
VPATKKNHGSNAAQPEAARRPILVLAVLVCAAIYLPTLRYQFAWDDEQLITANPRLLVPNPLSLLGQNFMPLRHGSLATKVQYYRPLTVFTFWLDRHVWGANPFGHHLTNVLLNALAVALLAVLLSLLSGRSRLWPVLAGLAVFSLHPAHVESVAFISGRTDVLATVFILTCLLCLVRYGGSGRWFWLAAATAASAAALLSKEVSVLLPLVGFAMLYSGGLGTRPKGEVERLKGSRGLNWVMSRGGRRALTAAFVLAATAVAYLVLRSLVLGGAALRWPWDTIPIARAQLGYVPRPVAERLLLFLNALGRYGQLVVFPFTHRLVYPDRAGFAAFGWPTLAGGFALVLLGWLGWRFRRTASGFGAAWFLAFIIPASNLFSIGATFLAERLLYLPLAGAAIMVLGGLKGEVERFKGSRGLNWVMSRGRPGAWRNAFAVVLFLYAVLMAAGSIRRMPVWRDPVTLFSTMVRESPNSADAHLNLGAALLKQNRDTLQAETEFRRTLAIRPDHPVAHNDLGDILRKRGEIDAARQEFLAAISLDSGYAEARGNLGIVLFQSGLFDSAFGQFRLARSLDPTLAPVYVNIGNCFVERNEPDSAKRSFWTAIRLQPDLSAAYVNLSRLYARSGIPDSAELVNRMLAARSGAWPRAVR